MRSVRLKLDLSPLKKFMSSMKLDAVSPSFVGPLGKMWKQIGVIYLSFVRKRFVVYSRGGGDWPKLKHKRKKGKLENAAILRDTGTLFNALSVGMPGNLLKRVPFGVRVGFGGPGGHPSGSKSIAEIAAIHNFGSTKANIPKREILAEMDEPTLALQRMAIRRGVEELGRRSEIG